MLVALIVVLTLVTSSASRGLQKRAVQQCYSCDEAKDPSCGPLSDPSTATKKDCSGYCTLLSFAGKLIRGCSTEFFFDAPGMKPPSDNGCWYDVLGRRICVCRDALCNSKSIQDMRIDECSSDPCNNGGTCIDDLLKYICKCANGWRGILCETVDRCLPSPCKNGGTCRENGTALNCICRPYYRGAQCEEYDNCYFSPCPNANYACVNNASSTTGYTCSCKNGFTGVNCQTAITTTTPTTPITTTTSTTQTTTATKTTGVSAAATTKSSNQTNQTFAESISPMACFPSDSVVLLRNGSSVPMARLEIGDEILTKSEYSVEPMFSPVIAFLDYKPHATMRYLSIVTVNGAKIRISPLHLIAVTREGVGEYIHARSVRVGDGLSVYRSGEFRVERVAQIESLKSEGAFAPLTWTGTVVVDDVIASCYTTVTSHSLGHAVFAPLRWWNLFTQKTSSTQEPSAGIHVYAEWLYTIAQNYVIPLTGINILSL